MNNHLRPIIRSLITEIFDSLLIQYWWLFLFFMNIDGDEQHHLGAGQVVRRSRDPLHAEGQRPGRRHVQHRSDDGQRPTGQGPRLRGHASAQDLPAGRDGHRGFGRLLHVRRADHPRHWRQRQRAQVRTARLSSAQHRRGNAQVEFWSCCRRFFLLNRLHGLSRCSFLWTSCVLINEPKSWMEVSWIIQSDVNPNLYYERIVTLHINCDSSKPLDDLEFEEKLEVRSF